jgi:hypothetical protein
VVSAAFQLVTVLGHIAMFGVPAVRPFAYFSTVVASSYPSQLLLGIAILKRLARRRTMSRGRSSRLPIGSARNSPEF